MTATGQTGMAAAVAVALGLLVMGFLLGILVGAVLWR